MSWRTIPSKSRMKGWFASCPRFLYLWPVRTGRLSSKGFHRSSLFHQSERQRGLCQGVTSLFKAKDLERRMALLYESDRPLSVWMIVRRSKKSETQFLHVELKCLMHSATDMATCSVMLTKLIVRILGHACNILSFLFRLYKVFVGFASLQRLVGWCRTAFLSHAFASCIVSPKRWTIALAKFLQ